MTLAQAPTAGKVTAEDLARLVHPLWWPWFVVVLVADVALLAAAPWIGESMLTRAAGLVSAGLIVALPSASLLARRGYRRRKASQGRMDHPMLPVVAATAVGVLWQADVLVAAALLRPGEAGPYVWAALLGRVVALGVGGATLWALRARFESGSAQPHQILHRAVAGVAIALAAAVVALGFLGPATISALSGPAAGPGIVWALAAAGAFVTLALPLAAFHAEVGSRAHRLTLACAGAELVLLGAHHSALQVALVTMLITGGAVLLLYHAAAAIARWTPPLHRLSPHLESRSAEVWTTANGIELSIVVPCHNAGPALLGLLEELERHLGTDISHEVIVVSDGSTDDTVQIAQAFRSPAVRVLHYPTRAGKGHALRVGLGHSRGSYVGFIDADGDINPEAIGPFLTLMRMYHPDIVLGSKRHPMSQVSYPPLRRALSWTYHKIARLLFRVNVRDTQTGLKVIRRDVLVAVLPRMLEKRYAFDLELLVVARLLGFTRVFEAPVRIDYRFSSQVDPQAAFRILLDSLAIFYRRYILDTYRQPGDPLSSGLEVETAFVRSASG
jgi:hypothetical protein